MTNSQKAIGARIECRVDPTWTVLRIDTGFPARPRWKTG